MGRLLYMGIHGSILLAAVICFRHFFFRQISKRFLVFLWICAIARLLLPVSIPVRLPAGSCRNTAAVSECRQAGAGTENDTFAVRSLGTIPAGKMAGKPETGQWAVRLQDGVFVIWLTAASFMAAFIVIRHLRSRRLYEMSLPYCDERAAAWLKAHRSIRKVTIRRSEFVSSPMTYGVIRPVILLPSALFLEDEEFLCVMEHEWLHIRWWDVLVKYLLYLTVCIYWFHPLVWMMARLLERDMELACDEEVVKTFPDSRRQIYALTLIRLAQSQRDSIWPVHAGFARHTEIIEERILFIMKTTKYTWKAVVLAIGMACCTITTFTAFAQEASEKTPMEAPIEDSIQQDQPVTAGGSVDLNGQEVSEDLTNVDEELSVNERSLAEAEAVTGRQIVQLAEQYVGAPYKSGGTDLSDGVDSAGFVQAIYAQAGICLPADLKELAAGRTDIPLSELAEGDIIIYSAADGSEPFFHAAIYDGNGKVIHASNMKDGVKISEFNYREISMAVRVLE